MENIFFQKLFEQILNRNFNIGKVLGVFIFLLILFIIYQIIFKFDKFKEVYSFFSNILEKRKKKKINKIIKIKTSKEKFEQEIIFLKTLEQNEKISNLLESILKEYNADRIYIFQYHNTGYFKTGLSQLKFSNTYEICANGIEPEKKQLQNIPISLVPFWNYQVRDKQHMFYETIDNIKAQDSGTYEILKLQNVKSIYNIGLYTEEGFPIGYFGIEYCRNRRNLNFEERMALIDDAEKISRLLI